jgi:hypothetical protein
MSFILDIVKFGLGQFGIEAKGNNPKAIAISAVTNVLEQKITNTVKKSNSVSSSSVSQSTVNSPQAIEEAVKDLEVKVNLDMKADTNASIPVVYGTGLVDGILVDAVLTNNNCTMWYAVAICETVGADLNGNPGRVSVDAIFWDGKRVLFGSAPSQIGGIADAPNVVGLTEGRSRLDPLSTKVDNSFSKGLPRGESRVNIYLYGSARAGFPDQFASSPNGGSESPMGQRYYTTSNTLPAYNLMPGWTVNHQMSNLVFALIRVDFDPERDVTKLGRLQFQVTNTLSNPADVMNDFMTNPIYGAGIPDGELDK